jgi:flagellar assembly factor FliW
MNTEELIEPQQRGLHGENRLHLPFGLLGFESIKNYILLANPQEAPFLWMRMLDKGKKAFLVVSPFLVMPDYQPDIPESDVQFLGLIEPADAMVFNICIVRPANGSTINLKGPIVINRHTMIGKQVIPNNAIQYALNHPLPVV